MYKFPNRLDPAENYPTGSHEWAHRMAARLQEAAESVDQHTATQLRRIILEISNAQAWNVWPDPPAGTPEDFCRIACDRSWEGLIKDVLHHIRDKRIARQMEYELRKANAAAQNQNRSQGTRVDLLRDNITKLRGPEGNQGGGTSTSYTLRRLLRERPDLVARIESGELSVNAAAKEAGFRNEPDILKQLLKFWDKASEDQRAAFLKEIQS